MRMRKFPYIVYVLSHSGPRFDPSISHALSTPRWIEQNPGFQTRGGSPLNSTDSVRYEWIEVRTAVAQNVNNVWKMTNPSFESFGKWIRNQFPFPPVFPLLGGNSPPFEITKGGFFPFAKTKKHCRMAHVARRPPQTNLEIGFTVLRTPQNTICLHTPRSDGRWTVYQPL